MKHFNAFLAAVSVVSAGGLLAFASGPAAQQAGGRVAGAIGMDTGSLAASGGSQLAGMIDLKTGIQRVKTPHVTVVEPAVDSDGDGFFETVLKVDLDPSLGFTKLNVILDYEGVPTGFTLNIGDSDTNDGGGGDWFSYQRDAEMQIRDQTLSVFSSDLGGGPLNATRLSDMFMGIQDSALKVSVADMFLSHGGEYTELDFANCLPGADLLYALGGQSDNEGPTNYEVYVGLNRVIFTGLNPDRIGAGLARVFITLE